MPSSTLHDDHDDFGGLHRDLQATRAAMDRRGLFRLAARYGAGFGALQLVGCGSNPASPSDSTGGSSGGGGSCSARIPEETQGPFPADGSNGPTVLALSGVVRNDIGSSFAGLSGTAEGVPLTIELTIVSVSTDQRGQPSGDVADRAAEICLRCGLCHCWLREQHRQPVARFPCDRYGVLGRLGARARHGERRRGIQRFAHVAI